MDEEIKVDQSKVERLKYWIVNKENQNLRNDKGDTEMIKTIRKRIEEEVTATTVKEVSKLPAILRWRNRFC